MCTAQSAVMAEKIKVDVVFALPKEQAVVRILVDDGATAEDALEQSGFLERFAREALETKQIGVWGRVVGPGYHLRDGDRVEVYRQLQRDPREARRELARSGLTMRESPGD